MYKEGTQAQGFRVVGFGINFSSQAGRTSLSLPLLMRGHLSYFPSLDGRGLRGG
jgi:hypothetical protein